MRVLILGAYGFIGLAIARALQAAGHEVVGLARSAQLASSLLPDAAWIVADMAKLQTPAAWHPHLARIEIVINAAGALQDSPRDRLALTQHTSIAALVTACESVGVKRLIQISAPGAATDSSTEFMRSKARADEAIRQCSLDWVILKPGLVIGQNAYGGSALIRMLAAFPVVQLLALADSKIQTVSLHDVARVVVDATDGKLPRQSEFDLVEQHAHRLGEVVGQFRSWLGFPNATRVINAPRVVVRVVAAASDALALFGWRSPLRSTAMQVLQENVVGDALPLQTFTGRALSPLAGTLAAMPATVQERWFARLYLAMPLMVAMLAGFWLASGLVGLIRLDAAAATIPSINQNVARGLVVAGAITDIFLGLAVLYRPWAARACWGMVVVSLAYLVLGSVLTPAVWLDPLGAFVKVLPATMLAWVTTILLNER